jgi:probable F420-dependent oxidoreductase
MKFGIAIRNMGPQSDPKTVRRCAKAAEQLGFDGLFVSDHLCIPPDQTEGSGGRYLDVVAALGFLAGITDRIRLGISVLVLPYRPAVLTAKQLATIQELSGERVILGVGVGWMKPEFDALGVDFKKRGAIATETLAVIHHLFANEAAAYNGPIVKFPAFVFQPRPARPPIWVGGNSARAVERVLRYGDGWHPMLRLEDLKTRVKELKDKARAMKRPEPEVIWRRGVRPDAVAGARDVVTSAREAGVTYFIVDFGRYADADQFERAAESFMNTAV